MMTQGNGSQGSPGRVSAALAAAQAAGHNSSDLGSVDFCVRFPGEDGGQSLAEMAERDLDAALQLLADRAQYITGAHGAAIALRRRGRNDMLCRATSGSNAPDLGTLLSTEFGLSGESVRTRRALRCDDAARDARVNHEVCRELGIASVVVMPVVDDGQVLGVFELFSGKAHAFGERDLSALERLSEMVETAVRLARAVEGLPDPLNEAEHRGAGAAAGDRDRNSDDEPVRAVEAEADAARRVVQLPRTMAAAAASVPLPLTSRPGIAPRISATQAASSQGVHPQGVSAKVVPSPSSQVASSQPVSLHASTAAKTATGSKPLFWSVALSATGDAGNVAATDQSHIPPVLRDLRKCEACGFPVSAGRTLCVECEEKRWRGQIKTKQVAPAASPTSKPAASDREEGRAPKIGPAETSNQAAAKAGSNHLSNSVSSVVSNTVSNTVSSTASNVVSVAARAVPVEANSHTAPADARRVMPVESPKLSHSPTPPESSTAAFVLSAGLEPSQSWLARNKFVFGAILATAGALAAMLLLR
jgi:GAF domain-containing protein